MEFTALWFLRRRMKTIAVDGLRANVDKAVLPTVLSDSEGDDYEGGLNLLSEAVEHIEQRYVRHVFDRMKEARGAIPRSTATRPSSQVSRLMRRGAYVR